MTILTLAVPSFNDAQMLEKTLRNLAPLVSKSQIEIIVSDNASPDRSSQVLQTFTAESRGEVKVFVQNTNLGFKGNLLFLAEHATGEYIWFVGIGECLQIEYLDPILDLLRLENPTNMVVSGAVADQPVGQVEELRVLKSTENGLTPLFSETISLNILKRASAFEALSLGANLTGDYWPHLEVILEVIHHEGTAANTIFIDNPVVAIAPNLDGWWFDRSEAFKLSLAQIKLLSKAVSQLSISPWLMRRLWRLRTFGLGEIVLRSRKNGRKFTKAEIRLMFMDGALNTFQKTLLNVANVTPLWIFRILAPLTRLF